MNRYDTREQAYELQRRIDSPKCYQLEGSIRACGKEIERLRTVRDNHAEGRERDNARAAISRLIDRRDDLQRQLREWLRQ